MSRSKEDGPACLSPGPIGLREAVDRWGPDLSKWPDIAQVRHAREALLSDRHFRAYRDGAVDADRRLKAAARALDERIAAGGALDRIAGAVLSKITPRPKRALPRYAALAAVIIAAGVLGSATQWVRSERMGPASLAVVQLDPLVFGPAEVGF